jgi:hypothetical protein
LPKDVKRPKFLDSKPHKIKPLMMEIIQNESPTATPKFSKPEAGKKRAWHNPLYTNHEQGEIPDTWENPFREERHEEERPKFGLHIPNITFGGFGDINDT